MSREQFFLYESVLKWITQFYFFPLYLNHPNLFCNLWLGCFVIQLLKQPLSLWRFMAALILERKQNSQCKYALRSLVNVYPCIFKEWILCFQLFPHWFACFAVNLFSMKSLWNSKQKTIFTFPSPHYCLASCLYVFNSWSEILQDKVIIIPVSSLQHLDLFFPLAGPAAAHTSHL